PKHLSLPANFVYILNNPQPNQLEIQPFHKPLLLHPHHQLNPSTFTPPLSLPTLSHLYSPITPPIGALKAPLHRRANENLMKILKEIG
ncbi:citrate/2-methylcitrate synthase, partial [Bacillus pseudomycoides]|uniref:citrate/2-methylcitrate synthase n=1 Tax=Bacillus pseudomycoides TaxID=64104 RepID=UPI0028D77403